MMSENKDPDQDGVVNSKRKKALSIGDYFSKRRKMSASNNDTQDDNKKRRELLASAAEKRLEQNKQGTASLHESAAEKLLANITKEAKSPNDTNENNSLNNCGTSGTSHDVSVNKAEVTIPGRFKRTPSSSEVLPKLTPTDTHTILFRPHVLPNKIPRPYPDTYKDMWDKNHVRMPCSPENLYPTHDKKIQKRWELIEATLLQPFQSSHDLEEAILVYNHHYKEKWNFECWHSYCNIELGEDQREDLFGTLLPNMVQLALQLPSVVTTSPRLLRQGVSQSITFSQKQVACLLANAFFCTYPRRNSLKNSEYSAYPDINFSKIFRGLKDVVNTVKTEKLKTVLNYFRRVLKEMPTGTVTYSRNVLSESKTPLWEKRTDEFCDLFVSSTGTIEDNGEGMLQVDFANRMIGGGVVGEGCVQEEIRFLICPELILARLFTEKLEPNESLVITGVERFSRYSGYAQTFKYQGTYHDFTQRDRWGRLYTQVVAIDAHVFHNYTDQFKSVSLKRELEKAYCGFLDTSTSQPSAIATGNWGCGAFGGDVHLKSLIQLMAAAVAKRDLVYFTFGDEELTKNLQDFHEFLKTSKVTVGLLWNLLVRYGRELKSKQEHIPLYPYLKKIFSDYTCDTDDEESSCNEENPLEIRGVPCEIPSDMPPLSPEYGNDTP
ncbi:poly(ADP-ribose) glycohydrolase-like [Hydractinia symbiolongicarpus]|uniref:poly(ADP-ribose) glycohydrolase-like n=1 Tax=Hydractinia symbiolongicarpus TaxID=13093 RepID=UPI00254E6224|nr:poly(ADP-ribose) glycohydrolase-like [Hydractinia symbiolongicarpus]